MRTKIHYAMHFLCVDSNTCDKKMTTQKIDKHKTNETKKQQKNNIAERTQYE